MWIAGEGESEASFVVAAGEEETEVEEAEDEAFEVEEPIFNKHLTLKDLVFSFVSLSGVLLLRFSLGGFDRGNRRGKLERVENSCLGQLEVEEKMVNKFNGRRNDGDVYFSRHPTSRFDFDFVTNAINRDSM